MTNKKLETRNYKDIVTMLYDGKSYSEIAHYLSLNANTIKSTMNRMVSHTPYATMLTFITEYKAKEEAEEKKMDET